ncbi:NAD(P)H dehydrogenase (quinone) [Streptomyces canarius]
MTAGGPEPHYAARGINGPIEDLLFPIHHGILYYLGISAAPVRAAARPTGTTRTSPREQRLLTLESAEPIPFWLAESSVTTNSPRST